MIFYKFLFFQIIFEKYFVFNLTAQSPSALYLSCSRPACLEKEPKCGLDLAGLEYGSVTSPCKNGNEQQSD
jgi:hypothetical protein